MTHTATQIELALRGAKIAKSALEFVSGTDDDLLLKLRFKQVVDDVEELRTAIVSMLKTDKKAQS